MRTLIIYAHPYEKSFNQLIFQTLVENKSQPLDVIDLYHDDFNLIYSTAELALFKAGETTSPLVKDYQARLLKAERLIFIFPIWWNDVPGIVKNFIDLVMKKNFAYVDTPRGVAGKLTQIKSITAITTSNSPTWYMKYFCGNSIQKVFLNATCKQLGIQNRRWLNLGNITNASAKAKHDFLKQLSELT